VTAVVDDERLFGTESPIDVHPGERFAAADFGHSETKLR